MTEPVPRAPLVIEPVEDTPAFTIPLEMVVPPDYLLAPESTNIPEDDLVRLKALVFEITPDTVSCVPLTSTVELPPSDIAPANEDVPVEVLIVPPFIVSASVVL